MARRRVQFADGTVMKADDAEIERQQQQYRRGGYRELDNPSDTSGAEAQTAAKQTERSWFPNIFGR